MQKYWMVITALGTLTVVIVFALVFTVSTQINPCSFFGAFSNADAISAPTTTKRLYEGADLVVTGKITHSAARCEGISIMTYMQVEVEEYLKNPQETRHITIKSGGGRIFGYAIYYSESNPIFNVGDRAVLFLNKDKPTDAVYRISHHYGIGEGSGKEWLRFVDLKPKHDLINNVSGNSSKQVTLLAESFFGFEGETLIIPTSFAYYNSTAVAQRYEINNINDLNRFGLSIEPAHNIVLLNASSTVEIELRINASEHAASGLYGFDVIVFDINDLDNYGFDKTKLDMNILGSFMSMASTHAVVLVNVTNIEYDAHALSIASMQSQPLVIAKFEPEQIMISKEVQANVTVSLTYSYTGPDIPQNVKLTNIFLDGDYIPHKGAENLRPDETIKRLFEQRRYGPAVPEVVQMATLISINDVDFHRKLKIGETVHVATFKIAATQFYPDELLNKKIIVRPDLTFNVPQIHVRANEIEVIVTG